MKIVGLMVTFNEMHFITYSLPTLLDIVDEVIILDGSYDGVTRKYLNKFNNVTVYNEEDYPTMSYQKRRQFVLDRAREIGGTHFICIDADEIMDVDLSNKIKKLLPLLRKGNGISCQWYHIVGNLYQRSDSIDCTMQAIAWVDDGSNLSGRDAIHEDKFPLGHPAQSDKYIFIDRPLLHFGAVDTEYFCQKRMYYKLLEYFATMDVNTVNLTYFRKIDDYTINFFCKYPKHINNGILHGPHNEKFLTKIKDTIISNAEYINDIYKLDIWRYHPSIIEYCMDNIDGFNKSKIRYTSNYSNRIVYLDMIIRQLLSLTISLKWKRVGLYIYRQLLWRIYGDASSSY